MRVDSHKRSSTRVKLLRYCSSYLATKFKRGWKNHFACIQVTDGGDGAVHGNAVTSSHQRAVVGRPTLRASRDADMEPHGPPRDAGVVARGSLLKTLHFDRRVLPVAATGGGGEAGGEELPNSRASARARPKKSAEAPIGCGVDEPSGSADHSKPEG